MFLPWLFWVNEATLPVVDAAGAAAAAVRIAPVPGKGLGAFSIRDRAAGEPLADYVGEILTASQVNARYHGVACTSEDLAWLASRRDRDVSTTGHYLVNVGDGKFVDAEDPDKSNWCRYINHSRQPNVALKTLPKGIDGNPRAWLVVLCDVEAGSELVFDYGDEYWFDETPIEEPTRLDPSA